MNSLHVVFDFPISPAIEIGLTPETAGQEARKMLALFLYEHKRISLGKACELGGMSYWEFAERNRELGITIPYSDKDLQADLGHLADV
jgi:predicted HTH domain antitoxin